ncbi:MAG: pseudouridine synthase [Planctomycetaceae bacterium]
MSTEQPPMNDDSSPAPAKSLGELAAEAAGQNLSEAPVPTEEAAEDVIEDELTDTSDVEGVEVEAVAESDWSDEEDSLVDEHEFDEESEDAGAIPETTTGIRLQRYLAACGLGSRRQCEELITTGRIGIDGETVTVLGTRIDPQTQKVTYDGDPLKMERKKYYMLNKPSGFICTNRDPQGRPRVVDLFPDFGPRLFTIGRLDENTTGLLLVTNDGDLAQRLAHPKYRIYRRYRAQVAGYPSKQTLDSLKEGFYFTEGKFRVHDVRVSKKVGRSCWVEITMGEGQNREIRRLFARVGHKVMKLERIGFGPLRLGRLPAGQFRDITRDELAQVHSILQRNMNEPPGFESDDASDESESRETRGHGGRDTRRPSRPQGRRREEGESRGPRYGRRDEEQGERRPPRAGSAGGARFKRRDDNEGGEGRPRYEGQRGRSDGERRPPRAGSSGGGRFKRRDDSEGGEGRPRYEGQRGRGEGDRRPPRAGSAGGGRFKRRDDSEGGEGRSRYEGQRGRGEGERRPPRAGSSGGGRFKRRDDSEGGEGRKRYEGQRGRGDNDRRGGVGDGERQQRRTGRSSTGSSGSGGGRGPRFSGGGSQGEGRPARGNREGGSGGRFGGDKRRGGPPAGKKPGRKGPPRGGKR